MPPRAESVVLYDNQVRYFETSFHSIERDYTIMNQVHKCCLLVVLMSGISAANIKAQDLVPPRDQ